MKHVGRDVRHLSPWTVEQLRYYENEIVEFVGQRCRCLRDSVFPPILKV